MITIIGTLLIVFIFALISCFRILDKGKIREWLIGSAIVWFFLMVELIGIYLCIKGKN